MSDTRILRNWEFGSALSKLNGPGISVGIATGHGLDGGAWRSHHATRHNTPIHNILSTTPQLSISQKALGTLPEDGNIMPKHVGATIHN
jgi:hypothetical protein